MPTQTDLAWRLLQIIALALPALAILSQALMSMNQRNRYGLPYLYSISISLFLMVAPLVGVGIIAASVIFFSSEVQWVKIATGLMVFSFLFVPLVLYRSNKFIRQELKTEYLDREKEAINEVAEKGELSDEEAEARISQIEAHQNGFLDYVRWRLRRPDQVYRTRKKRWWLFQIFFLIFGIYVILSDGDVWVRLSGLGIVLTTLLGIGARFVEDC